jgi:hypothetical protein
MQVKHQSQGYKVKSFGTNGKALSLGILILNIKVLVHTIQKLKPRLIFWKDGSNTKVKVKGTNFKKVKVFGGWQKDNTTEWQNYRVTVRQEKNNMPPDL